MSNSARTSTGSSRSATAEPASDTKHVGEKLVELCRAGKNFKAIDELYDAGIVSVENMAPPDMPLTMTGVEAIREKNRWWFDNNDVHEAVAEGPLVNGDRFAVHFRYAFSPKSGDEKGKRTKMEEIAVYTVRDGRIVREEFFG